MEPTHCAEQTLEFCGRLHAAGIRVGLIKPTNNASLDAQLWLDDRPVTTEFKAFHDPDEPTVLVVLTQHLFPATDAHTLGEAHRVADALREGLREQDVPSAILIHEEPFWPPPSGSLLIEDGWRFVLGASEGRYRAALLVTNPSARVSLTATEFDQLIGPTMRW